MKLSEKTKKILWIIFAVVLVVTIVVWIFLSPTPEHIEDTNGKDNTSLQKITTEDVAQQKMGKKGVISKDEAHIEIEGFNLAPGQKYSSKKFTGVYSIHEETIIKGSDVHVQLAEFEINSGNFAFYILLDGKVVGEVEKSEFAVCEFLLQNVEKTASVEYVLAGESADFSFVLL